MDPMNQTQQPADTTVNPAAAGTPVDQPVVTPVQEPSPVPTETPVPATETPTEVPAGPAPMETPAQAAPVAETPVVDNSGVTSTDVSQTPAV